MAMKPTAFKPVRGKSISMKLDAPKAAAPKPAKVGIAPPVTPGKLARAPEKNDVLITTRKSPDIVRTTVRERTTPVKKGR